MDDFLNQVRRQAEGKCKPELTELFVNCYTNTLDTTIRRMEDNTAHVITGDIPAMWLRDSSAQLRPYLFQAKEDEELRELIAGVVRRQFQYICIDAYANAFNESPSGACWAKDDPEQNPWVWERKFEVDSLCYPIQLAYLGKIRDAPPSLMGISTKGLKRFSRYSERSSTMRNGPNIGS